MLILSACRPVRPTPALARPRCPRLSRPHHAAVRRARQPTLRVAAEARPSPASEAELRSLMMRLREDDVEYFDLKGLCKGRSLGGRDSKENLRAKLLRSVRQELGLPVYGPANVPLESVRQPQAMSKEELHQLFETRGCMMPNTRIQQLTMANALLVADGLLDMAQVVLPQASGPWSSMTVAQLKQACSARSLSSKGLRDDLIKRLQEWDAAAASEAAAAESEEAAAAAGGEPPSTTDNAQLLAAQQAWATMHRLDVGQLREEVQRRGLKMQGTRQVLLAKLSEALEREVVHALGGEQRLAHYAASAVGRMSEGEVEAELAARGASSAQYASPAAASGALQALMQRDWVAEALHGGQVGGSGGEEEWNGGGEGGEGSDGGGTAQAYLGYDAAAGQPERAWVWGRRADPTLSLALVVGGHTALQRDAALAGARLAAHLLQSDACHGLLPRAQLEQGAGGEREGVAVQAYYAAQGKLHPLTWEQLHSASAAELDIRLALPGAAAPSPAGLAAGADVVLPLGLPPGAPALLADAGGKVAGSAAQQGAAELAADRLAFGAAAAGLGFATVPSLRLGLADFADASACQSLGELAAFERVADFAMQQLRPGVLPRLAVAGSVLGGSMVTGPAEALLAALDLMHEHGVDGVVVEAVVPGAHHFTCTVLAAEQGAVALAPTQLSYWDVEDDIAECSLRMERWLAANEASGLDVEGVDGVLDLLRQEQRTHPAYLGGPAGPSQQLRQSTPPAGLSAAAAEAVRHASLKLFGELGLRDYAQFSGWVLPPMPEPAEQEAAVAAALEAAAAAQEAAAAEEEEEQQQQQRPQGLSFAQLAEIDAAARAEAAAAAPADGITAADRSRATDTTAGALDAAADPEAGKALTAVEGGAEQQPADYGTYNGLRIDGGTRPTQEEVLKGGPFGRPIPDPPSEPEVEALPDLSGASPAQLCALPGGHTVSFALLSLTPDIGDPTSVLCQQAAAAGLSHEALLRHLVSAAAVRGGHAPLPPLPEAAAAVEAAADEAAAVEEEAAAGPRYSKLALLAPLDEEAVEQLLASEFRFSNWVAPEEGQEAGPSFEVIDATGDPSLDPVAQQQQWEQQQQEAAAAEGLYGYDEIREAGLGEGGGDWAAAAEGGGAAAAAEAPHPTKQRVWVLLGGDGADRTQSLRAGLHTCLSLRNDPELMVEAFMLEPSFAGRSEEDRRRRLLDRRLDLMQLGLDDDEILEEAEFFDLSRIRHPPPAPSSTLAHQGVWRLSGSGLVRGGVEDLQVACEAALATANASWATLEEAGGDIAGAQLSVVRQELQLAGATLDGSCWGGDSPHHLEPAEHMWVMEFAAQAQAAGALVFLALAGQPAAQGPLQRLLEEAGVPFTGSGHLATETCADKGLLTEQLLDLSTSGISTAPQQRISLPELAAQCEDEASADRLFDQLRSSLGAGPVSLTIRPAHACNGLGVVRAMSGRDLGVYAQAVQAWDDTIPGIALDCGADVAMPVPPPTQFVVEPYILTEAVQVLHSADGSVVPLEGSVGAADGDPLAAALRWPAAASNEWLAVSAVLLGEPGRMRCLGPSVRVLQLREAAGGAATARLRVQQLYLEAEADEEEDGDEAAALRAAAALLARDAADGDAPRQLAGAFELTPPPASLASEQAVASARLRLEMVADRLGLSGAAEVAGYMQVESGEVVVGDVTTLPDLSPGALIFKQAAAATPALSPAEVVRELIRAGLSQPMEERDDLQVLDYPQLGDEAADYDYPRDAAYTAYPGGAAYDVAEYEGQYGSTAQQ